jgi:GTP-binding protein
MALQPPSAAEGARRGEDVSGGVELEGAELEEAARKLFSGPVTFLKSAPELKFLPDPGVPEIAFAGRSNVGKSSLLNRLTNRSSLARTSNTPGRTQELNIFEVGDPIRLRLIDMPGYGFAKAPKDLARKWRYLVNDYLRGRQVLKRTLLLIDSRHGIKDVDLEIMKMLDDAAVSYRLILTKADKIKASELAEVTERTVAEGRKHPAAHPEIIVTSSEKGLGMDSLRAAVLEAALL